MRDSRKNRRSSLKTPLGALKNCLDSLENRSAARENGARSAKFCLACAGELLHRRVIDVQLAFFSELILKRGAKCGERRLLFLL